MQYFRSVSMIAVIVSLFMFCSCFKGGSDLKFELSPPDKSLNELANTIYDKSQLLEIAMFTGTLGELDAQYPIECIRKDKNTYRVTYLGHESVSVLVFDDSGNKLFGKTYCTKMFKHDFSDLTEGKSLEEVRELDPNGEYLFLFTGRNDIPKVSYHYSRDGYLISIKYDAMYHVIDIKEELI